jgi:hypothetical protein
VAKEFLEDFLRVAQAVQGAVRVHLPVLPEELELRVKEMLVLAYKMRSPDYL